jgi:hypothetical protein
MRLVLVVVAIAALTANGCGTAFYYGSKRIRTYEFERRVQVVVRSDPTGATIMTSDGLVLGQAPLIVEEKVQVRRIYRSNRVSLIILGCILDLAAAATIGYAADHPAPGLVRLGAKGLRYALFLDSAYAFYTSETTTAGEEQVIPRTIEFKARHDGLTDARVQLEIPTMRAATLRFRREYTFDEALKLWARETEPPPTAESIYELGNAYWNLARRGIDDAMKRALELLTLYFQRYGTATPAVNVRPSIKKHGHPERREQ